MGSVISYFLSSDNINTIFWVFTLDFIQPTFPYHFTITTMSFKFVWIAPLLIFFTGSKATLGRSPQHEMRKIKEVQVEKAKINLDEFWPFPQTISVADPYVLELENELTNLNMGS